MIELERHIEILLLSNDCVIVPDLGGFMAHHINARYDEADKTFLPPLRTLGFNSQLTMNDSLLVQSYIEAYDISYPEALRRIENEVAELRQHLEAEGKYVLNDIGVLSLNEEGKLEFNPCEAGLLTPSLYGLSSFEMLPLQKAEHVHQTMSEESADALSEGDSAITIKMSWLRNVAAVAAAVIAFFMIGSPVYNSSDGAKTQQSAFIPLAAHQAEEQKPATPSDSTVKEAPVVQAEDKVVENAAPHYCIVLASQVSTANAELFISQLNQQGFTEAYIMENKFRRVVYGKYQSEAEAYSRLHELRRQSKTFNEAWVMKTGN